MAATDYDFILTRNELIEESYRKCGVLADGEYISAEQLSTGNKKLNSILKKWEGDGCHLWTYLTDTLTTTSGQAYKDVPTTNGLAYIEKAYVVVSSNDIEIDRITRREYEDIQTKTDPGQPTVFAHFVAEGRVYFWPRPDATYTVKLFGLKRLKDWETADSTGEFPARWMDAIRYALAVDLAEDYTLPLREIQYLDSKAQREYVKARGKEVDISECSSFVNGSYTMSRRY